MLCRYCGNTMKETWRSYEKDCYCDCEVASAIEEKKKEIQEAYENLRKLESELEYLKRSNDKYAEEIREVKRRYGIDN